MMKIVCILLIPLVGLPSTLECPRHCKDDAYDAQTGTCLHGCADGYYSSGSYCLACPAKCRTCRSVGHCDQCDPGFYGTFCKYSSHLCIDNQCEKNGCTKGCIQGYFTKTVRSYIYDGVKYTACQVCPPNCISCDSFDQCTSCIDGYSGPTCCKDCPQISGPSTTANTPTCDDKSFASSNRQCVPCPPNCLSCISYTNCITCKDDYYGSSCSDFNCMSISPHCDECTCLLSKCRYKSDYICSECRKGYHGLRCEFQCDPNCGQDTACGIEGKCLHGCKRGFWGDRCTGECSIGCVDGTCDKLTGYCDCMPGYSTAGGDSLNGSKCELVVTDADKAAQSGAARGPGGSILTWRISVVLTFYLVINFLNK